MCAKNSVIVQFLIFFAPYFTHPSGLVWFGLVWSGALNLALDIYSTDLCDLRANFQIF